MIEEERDAYKMVEERLKENNSRYSNETFKAESVEQFIDFVEHSYDK